MNRQSIFILLLMLAHTAWAIEPRQFDTPRQEARYDQLTSELRCLVCAGESIADSNALLAADMRDQVFAMLKQGKSNAEVKAFLTDRYGDIVLFRPPLKSRTLFQWFGPLLLILAGAVVLFRSIAARNRAATDLDTAPEDEPS